jgi:micrococcal nuclease
MEKKEYLYNAIVVNIVDGDTIDMIVDLGFKTYIQDRFRLYGIDTKEMNSPDDAIREEAKRAKEFLTNMLFNKKVVIKTYKKDKYGRYLADVFLDGSKVNDILLEVNLAVSYFGKNN